MATTAGWPVVRVPVLSKTISVMACACSKAMASLMRMPRFAATPVPTSSAVGVASPSAQGQAMTNTATAFSRAFSQSPFIPHQPVNVASATTNTTGTKTLLTRSTRR